MSERSIHKKIIEGVFSDVKFQVLTGIGTAREVRGGYLICDGGYPKHNCFICPLHKRVDRQSVIFSEWMESSRKDVECTFGQIKNRFRILKKPLEMSDEFEMEMLFKACCVFHNMILIYDHRDLEYWETDIDWELMDPDPEDMDDTDVEDNWDDYVIPEVTEANPDALPVIRVSSGEILHLKPKGNNTSFTEMLCTSFSYQYEMELLSWPRNFSNHHKQLISNARIELITARIEVDIYNSLVVAPSKLLAKDSSGNYTTPINNGLFAGIHYKPKERIVDWKDGERISTNEYGIRVAAGEGGYALRINAGEVMDYYSIRNRCKASMANSNFNALNTVTGKAAKINAVMHAYRRNDKCTFYLTATTHIRLGEEIIWDYYKDYVFPPPQSRKRNRSD